jgi:hypothetical protein
VTVQVPNREDPDRADSSFQERVQPRPPPTDLIPPEAAQDRANPHPLPPAGTGREEKQ